MRGAFRAKHGWEVVHYSIHTVSTAMALRHYLHTPHKV